MVSAFVLVNCHFPFDIRIMDKISKMPSVVNVYRISGRYDLIVKVNANTEDEVKEIVSRDINALQGVDATVTMIIAKQYMKSSDKVV
jgi:DNA-binding Lrp family transcriptional regulator